MWPACASTGSHGVRPAFVLAVDPVAVTDGLIRVMRALVDLAFSQRGTGRWTVEVGADLPDLTVTGRVVRLAADLYGSDRDGNRFFLYPPTVAAILADALHHHGLPADEAAARAWDLPLRNTLNHARVVLHADTVRRGRLRDLRRGARRTNTAVRTIATHLGRQPPVLLDLTALCAMVRKLEQRTHDEFLLS